MPTRKLFRFFDYRCSVCAHTVKILHGQHEIGDLPDSKKEQLVCSCGKSADFHIQLPDEIGQAFSIPCWSNKSAAEKRLHLKQRAHIDYKQNVVERRAQVWKNAGLKPLGN